MIKAMIASQSTPPTVGRPARIPGIRHRSDGGGAWGALVCFRLAMHDTFREQTRQEQAEGSEASPPPRFWLGVSEIGRYFRRLFSIANSQSGVRENASRLSTAK
jgi:hypothetical protein